MGKRQGCSKARLIQGGISIYAGLVSLNASAFVLGDLELHSYLGQPLRASIPITVGRDELVGPECFSLGKPSSRGESSLSYITQAALRLEETPGRVSLKISTAASIQEPYVKLLIQAGCGEGSRVREFVALLDPVETSVTPPRVETGRTPAAPEQPRSSVKPEWVVRAGETLRSITAGFFPRQPRMQGRMAQAIRDANPQLPPAALNDPLPEGFPLRVPDLRSLPPLAEAFVPVPVKAPKARSVSQPAVASVEPAPLKVEAPEGEFRLKLSTSDLDLSLLGKLTEEQRQQLREKQLLLDADDQVANTLSMKNRIKQLETQISELQAALGNTNSRLAMSERLAAAPRAKAEAPADVEDKKSGMFGGVSLRVMVGMALILALLFAGWWRWHRRQAEKRLDSELEHDFPADSMMPYATVAPASASAPASIMVEAAVAATELHQPGPDEEDDTFHPTSIFDNPAEAVTFTEAESVLDEADLYLAYGWANRAIELLQEYLENHPDDTQLWKKLLEIYSGQGMKQEFEQLALRCQVTMEDSGLWAMVREMGRELDPKNPLYRATPEEQEAASSTAAENRLDQQADIPTLDTPLEFVLDEQVPKIPPNIPPDEPSAPAKEAADTLELDPLFPEFLDSVAKDASGAKDPGKV